MTRILIIDDDPFSRRFLERTLQDAGWETRIAADGDAGWEAWTAARPQPAVIICDVRMPRLNGPAGRIVVGDLELDISGAVLARAGEPVNLTRTELAAMAYLMRNVGRIVSPAQVLGAVWGEAYEDENEILRTTVLRIRRKLERDPARPRYLRTHVGMGYSISGG